MQETCTPDALQISMAREEASVTISTQCHYVLLAFHLQLLGKFSPDEGLYPLLTRPRRVYDHSLEQSIH